MGVRLFAFKHLPLTLVSGAAARRCEPRPLRDDRSRDTAEGADRRAGTDARPCGAPGFLRPCRQARRPGGCLRAGGLESGTAERDRRHARCLRGRPLRGHAPPSLVLPARPADRARLEAGRPRRRGHGLGGCADGHGRLGFSRCRADGRRADERDRQSRLLRLSVRRHGQSVAPGHRHFHAWDRAGLRPGDSWPLGNAASRQSCRPGPRRRGNGACASCHWTCRFTPGGGSGSAFPSVRWAQPMSRRAKRISQVFLDSARGGRGQADRAGDAGRCGPRRSRSHHAESVCGLCRGPMSCSTTTSSRRKSSIWRAARRKRSTWASAATDRPASRTTSPR